MASNPIQRRSRQAFLVGFLIALVIGAIVAFLLFMQISNLNSELELATAEEPMLEVYVANTNIEEGEGITESMLTLTQIPAEYDTNQSLYFAPIDFAQLAEENEDREEGDEIGYISKVEIHSGSLITLDMILKSEDWYDSTERIMEYNMIVLPSKLSAGDYVDIRISLPDGTSYVVLSKKYVEDTNATGIWMKMSEVDILTLENAIVETYIMDGSRLYATIYSDPDTQEAAEISYAVSNTVLSAIEGNPNIVDKAKSELEKRRNTKVLNADNGNTSDWDYERSVINSYLNTKTSEEKIEAVEEGNSTENDQIAEQREEYISELEAAAQAAEEY